MSLKQITQSISWLILALLATPLAAAEDTGSRSARTISFSSTAPIDKAQRDEQLEQAEADILAPLSTQGFRTESNVKASYVAGSSYSGDFSIYNVTTDLISDIDYDGFYHRFSLEIDADTVYDSAYIYARLYVSYEGGPWDYYASSNDYYISGDSDLDSFIIETELADGFPPGYYDVRIELYDADYGDWLLTVGPYDDASLSALPLEDSYYDDSGIAIGVPIETEVVIAGTGAMSWWLLVPVLLVAVRRFSK
jgi:hypothetical protein